MIAPSSPLAAQHVAPTTGSNPLGTVLIWELRRLWASHIGRALIGLPLLFFAGLLWLKHSWLLATDGGEQVLVAGGSALGLLSQLVFVLLLLFGLCLPFLAADSVARDYRQRTHELLMTTPVPTWSYVWGRFLAALLLCIGLAVELLLATFAVNLALHRAHADYPAPDPGTLLGLWALTVLPTTVLLASVSFALGTFWPRAATVLKLIVLVAWVMLVIVGSSLVYFHASSWYPYWNPTSYDLALRAQADVLMRYQAQAGGVQDAAARLTIARAVQGQLLDVRPWILPHTGLGALGLGLVATAAFGFRRFRAVIG